MGHTHINTHTHIHKYAHTHKHRYVVYTYTNTYMHIYTHKHTYRGHELGWNMLGRRASEGVDERARGWKWQFIINMYICMKLSKTQKWDIQVPQASQLWNSQQFIHIFHTTHTNTKNVCDWILSISWGSSCFFPQQVTQHLNNLVRYMTYSFLKVIIHFFLKS